MRFHFSDHNMSDYGIVGKRALVTGGGRGIGLAVAKKLLELRATVYIADCNTESLKNAVLESGNKLIPLEVDVTKWDGTRNIIKDILPIDLLVNNAGIGIMKPILESTEQDYSKIMDVNLKATINLTQFVASDLIARNRGGRIVNMASVASLRATENLGFYCCTKAAVDMATKCFALELGPKNIRVNAVNPTWVRTEGTRHFWTNPEELQPVLERISLKRIAELKDIADAVAFLLSDKSEMITGHSLLIDGGYTIS